jgi:hypothetical protein
MRKRIVAAFEVGWNPDGFDASLDEVDDPKKQENYQRIRRGLRKWAGVRGKRRYVWQTPKRAVWKSNGLTVIIGPELWVDIDGQSYVIKLYFKSDKLSQQKVNLLLHLMQVTIGKNGAVGILDLPQGKLFLQTQDPPDGIDTLLEAEAAAFTVLWDGV